MAAQQEAVASPNIVRRLSRDLARWFRCHRRDLPWRHTRDPYPIWISEVMLQQTQVATVVPYFQQFLAAFPTVSALAGASEEDVLRSWEGLGYYRRARNLHESARRIVREHGGRFPTDPVEALRLPGLGRYSVGAILSQAYNLRLPIVEANSRRVLCRFFGFRGDPRKGRGERWLWKTAEQVLPARQPGDFNQALMELGALVCYPTAPRCDVCPLARDCQARLRGLQEKIPPRAAAPTVIEIEEVAVIVQRGRRVLAVQRPRSAERWAGLWEFPHGAAAKESAHDSAVSLVQEWTGLRVRLEEMRRVIRHSLTRHQIRLTCFSARHISGTFRSEFYEQGRWVAPEQLGQLPFSSPQRRLAETIKHADQ